MEDAETEGKASKARKRPVQASIAKALFFFEKGGATDGPGPDAKWLEWRDRYLRRGARFEKVLEAQGLMAAIREVEPAE